MATREEINAHIEALGLSLSATFVPLSQSRNAQPQEDGKPWLSINWKVKLSKNGATLESDYAQGLAHLPGFVHSSSNKLLEAQNIRYAVENGKWDAAHDKAGFRTKPQYAWKPIPAPSIVDVLYCLIQDYSVLDHDSFESWAQDYGYDTDSRKAEATYRECMAQALKLRAMLGDAGIAKLQELYQDF